MSITSYPTQPLNRLYWYYERILSKVGKNANSCEWLILGKRPDRKTLETAARMVAQRHPVLRARLIVGLIRPLRWIDDAPPPEIEYETNSGAAPENAVDLHSDAVWKQSLDLHNGPLWRLRVICYDDAIFLQIITTHVFTDGKSANLLVHDLVAAYDAVFHGKPFDTTPIEPTSRKFGKLYLSGLGARQRFSRYLSAGRAIWNELTSSCIRLPEKSRRIGSTRIIIADLGPALLSHLRKRSQSEAVSRHVFYVTAFSETVWSYLNSRGISCKDPLKIIDNFSIRTFASENIDTLYELCAVPYSLEVPLTQTGDTSFRNFVANRIDVLKSGSILNEVARYLLYTTSAVLSPKLLTTRLVLKSVVKSNLFLSNVGVVPAGILQPSALDVLDYYSFSQLFPPGRLMIFLSTTETNIRVVCLWDDAVLDETDVKTEILAKFIKQLASDASIDLPNLLKTHG